MAGLVLDTGALGDLGVNLVSIWVTGQMGWIFRPLPTRDHGIDGEIELVEDGVPTGRLIAVQVKCGDSYFADKTPGGWHFGFGDRHAAYWTQHSLPVIVVLVDHNASVGYWAEVSLSSTSDHGRKHKLTVPRSQVLGAGALGPLGRVARQRRSGGDAAQNQFEEACDRLPSSVAFRLGKVRAEADQFGGAATKRLAERVANHLAAHWDAPSGALERIGLRQGSLLDDKETSPALGELWAAIGTFATEHRLFTHAADAYVRTAKFAGADAGRWTAFAGASVQEIDPARAERLLLQARAEPGGKVLAALGLMLLDAARRGLKPPFELPPEVVEAAAAADRGEPLLLAIRLHLAAHAATCGDLDRAVQHAEVVLSAEPTSSAGRMQLAELLLRRLAAGLSPIHEVDARRAAALATVERAERRRWGGASQEPADLLMTARTLLQDFSAAVAVAIPLPEGEATPAEAADEPLTLHAARIALQISDASANALIDRLESQAVVAHIEAKRCLVEARPVAEQEAAWRHALSLDGGPELTVLAAWQLSQLGVWPIPQVQELCDEGRLDQADVEIFEANALSVRGEEGAALRLLRQAAPRSLDASIKIAGILEGQGRPDEAVAILDQAASQFGEVGIRLTAVEVLLRADRFAEAERRAWALLARPSTPAYARPRLRHMLITRAQARRDWPEAEDLATGGLEESMPPPAASSWIHRAEMSDQARQYAWILILSRHNAGRLREAHAAYQQLQPAFRTSQEVQLWLQLTSWAGWRGEDVQRALELVDEFPGVPLTAHMVAFGRPSVAAAGEESDEFVLSTAAQQRRDALMEEVAAQGGVGGLRVVKGGVEGLGEHLKRRAGAMPHARDIQTMIFLGVAPVALLTRATRDPYLDLLLTNRAGILPACSESNEVFDLEVNAAAGALGGPVIIDPSAVALVSLLSGRWEELRSRFSQVLMPRPCFEDLMNSKQHLEVFGRSPGVVSYDPATERVVVEQHDAGHRTRVAQRIRTLMAVGDAVQLLEVDDLTEVENLIGDFGDGPLSAATNREGAWLGALQAGINSGHPVWCDDVTIREMCTAAGVATFGTLALLHHLIATDAITDTTDEDLHLMFSAGVIDLPRRRQAMLRRAEADGWRPLSIAVSMARAAWWLHDEGEPYYPMEDFLAIMREVHGKAPEHLPRWVRHAAQGLASLADPELRPKAAAHVAAATLLTTTGVSTEYARAFLSAAQEAAAAVAELHRIATDIDPELWPAQGDSDIDAAVLSEFHDHLFRVFTTAVQHGGASMPVHLARLQIEQLLQAP
ncbi:DUF4365 domain-containing protein [Longispora sp. K20-0274]|uniref:DUF4365 domain-containing protein n=1 Tax=Longispora sp. K20-0274 TaxID=3088255 RepID=UPI003999A5E7